MTEEKPFHERVSATEADWSRERPNGFWDPGRRLLRSIRKYQALKDKRGPFNKLRKKYWSLQHIFWSTVSGAEISLECKIGGGLLIPHPNGIVIHPAVEIGPNCLIFQQVTLGMNEGKHPRVGGHVDIGAGAKIIGGVTLGDHVRVGANSVVNKSAPDKSIVVGIPARPIADADE